MIVTGTAPRRKRKGPRFAPTRPRVYPQEASEEDEPMALTEFLHSFFETGRVQVSDAPGGAVSAAESASLQAAELRRRADLAEPRPPFAIEDAEAGARLLYLCAQAVAARTIKAAELRDELRAIEDGLGGPAAARHYSVDLCLAALPELAVIARRLARADPILAVFVELGGRWPLSSVGMVEVAPPEKLEFWDHPGLRRLYLDRIFERRDRRRAAHPLVAEALRADLGAHPELAPELAAELDGAAQEVPRV